MWLIFMKGIYLLIRTEKLSLLQTKASLANVQSILCKSTGIPWGPTRIMSWLIIWIMRYFWFIASALFLFHHSLLISTWRTVIPKCWCMKSACVVHVIVFVYCTGFEALAVYKMLIFKCVFVFFALISGFCYGPFYPSARHSPGKTQLGFQPLWYQQRWIYH